MAARISATDAAIGLANLLKWHGISGFEREYRFAPPRRWRADLAFLEPIRLLVEVNGGGWIAGRHSREPGMSNDAQKQNTAQLLGWTVLVFTPSMIDSGEAVETIRKALAGAPLRPASGE